MKHSRLPDYTTIYIMDSTTNRCSFTGYFTDRTNVGEWARLNIASEYICHPDEVTFLEDERHYDGAIAVRGEIVAYFER